MDGLETKLDEMLVKKAPVQLPENAKKWIVEYSPYIGLVLGVFGLFAALALWHAGHVVNSLVDYSTALSRSYGVDTGSAAHLGFSYWVALIALVAQCLLDIVAFPGLKARSKKTGWNLLFYSAIFNLLYGVFNAVYNGGFFSLVWTLIGSVIGLYFLFQIRSYYNGVKTVGKAAMPTPPVAQPPVDTATK